MEQAAAQSGKILSERNFSQFITEEIPITVSRWAPDKKARTVCH